ncbi:RNA polymerase sigma-70 factor [Rapidithrix thailandica]|uniref:RNA polymerase sigma-70 factor n=1 Tax=Rapidithrix thailandica TaxID=413964 RepID=A0AAW9SAK5_9BACT
MRTPIQTKDDIRVIEELKAGNFKALEQLFEEYYPLLCRFGFRQHPNPPQVEELVADVFIALWERRAQLVIHSSIKAYLFKAVRNQIAQSLRRQQPHFITTEELTQDLLADSPTPEGHLLYKEFSQNVFQAIEALPASCQTIFKLHKLDQLTYREIAEIMEVSMKTVENQMGMALKILSQQVLKEGVVTDE